MVGLNLSLQLLGLCFVFVFCTVVMVSCLGKKDFYLFASKTLKRLLDSF